MMNWYKIPGFSAYDINYFTKEIRSCKHYKAGFHIMQVIDSGAVKLIDDHGVRRYIKVDSVYDITFNHGNKLEPRGDQDMYCGGMTRINSPKASSVQTGTYMLTFGSNGITAIPSK